MGRVGTILSGVLAATLLAILPGCGSSTPPTPGFGVPAVVRLAPSPTASMDLGSSLQFIASALNANKSPLTTTFTFRSSKPSVVSIAENGLACAGAWDSLSIPIVCTPGGAGTAVITASSSGVTSSPVTVYVHEPIARIDVTPIPLNAPPAPGPNNCYTALAGSQQTANSQTYEAVAWTDDASGLPTVDITSTVGPFSWSASQPTVASLALLNTHGIPNGQVRATAKVPGLTQIIATVANAASAPQVFETCPVQSVALSVNGGNSISAAKGNSTRVNAAITDIAGNVITPALTWSSSDPTVASVSTTGVVTSANAGGSSITASCIPPGCNVNLTPMQAIYPAGSIQATYTGTTSTPFGVFVSTMSPQCAAKPNCEALLVPITGTPASAGTGVALPSMPNSLRFEPKGATAFLGSQQGLIRVVAAASPPTITPIPSVKGKLLAISPDGTRLIVADNQSVVKQVFIYNNTAGSSTNLLISGATAAAFSPDGLKAFIVAGTSLYVYSAQAPLQVGTLPAAGTDADFLANGMFGFVAQGSGGTSYVATCDDPSTPLSSQISNISAAANFIRALPDSSGMIGLAPPDLTFIHAAITGFPLPVGANGCPAPLGGISLSPTVTSFDLGQGVFNPIAFLMASDGQKIYIVPDAGDVIVYDIPGNQVTFRSLVGNPHPLAAALAPDGQTLYVSADDSQVHIINTVSGGDLTQVPVPSSSLCTVTTGGPPPKCLPDLLEVRP